MTSGPIVTPKRKDTTVDTRPLADKTGGTRKIRPEEPPEKLTRRFMRGLKRAFVENAGLKFVALVLSITLFIMVNTNRDAVIGVNVGVSYSLPEDKVLVSPLVDQVRLNIKGSWRRIKRFDEREIERIRVNLQSWQGGDYTFSQSAIRLPPGLALLSITPASMPVRFEPRQEKTVPVRVAAVGAPTYGYKVANIASKPSQVTIRGAKSAVDGMSEVMTRDLDLTGRSSSFQEVLPLVRPEPASIITIVDDAPVEVDVTIVEEMDSHRLEGVPVEIRPGPGFTGSLGRYLTEPEQVDVVLHGPRLLVESVSGDQPKAYKAYVEVVEEDGAGKPRDIAVQVEGLPSGVGVEIEPKAVSLRIRRPE